MTAPLPPPSLTFPGHDGLADMHYWNEAAVRLAVREALERAVENVRNLSVAGGPTQLRQAALDAIRAMIKELDK